MHETLWEMHRTQDQFIAQIDLLTQRIVELQAAVLSGQMTVFNPQQQNYLQPTTNSNNNNHNSSQSTYEFTMPTLSKNLLVPQQQQQHSNPTTEQQKLLKQQQPLLSVVVAPVNDILTKNNYENQQQQQQEAIMNDLQNLEHKRFVAFQQNIVNPKQNFCDTQKLNDKTKEDEYTSLTVHDNFIQQQQPIDYHCFTTDDQITNRPSIINQDSQHQQQQSLIQSSIDYETNEDDNENVSTPLIAQNESGCIR